MKKERSHPLPLPLPPPTNVVIDLLIYEKKKKVLLQLHGITTRHINEGGHILLLIIIYYPLRSITLSYIYLPTYLPTYLLLRTTQWNGQSVQ